MFKMETTSRSSGITHHHEFIDAPLIDAEPLQTHRLEEVPVELDADFDVGKAVNESAEVLCELLLHERLIRHPHTVVQALPQAQKVIVGEFYRENNSVRSLKERHIGDVIKMRVN